MVDNITERMQQVLDGQLSREQEEELFAYLRENEHEAEKFDRLMSVDQLLTRSQHVRAPERLAITIMARIAQSVEEQTQQGEMTEEMRQAIQISLGLAIVITMPMMIAASWLVLYAKRGPEVLTAVFYQVVALMRMMLDALGILIDEVETLAKEDPKMAPVALALIPVTLHGILETVRSYTEGLEDALYGDEA